MGKIKINMTLVLAFFLGMAFTSFNVMADGGIEKCELKRTLSASERDEIKNLIGKLKALMPAPPKGWEAMAENNPNAIPDETSRDLGCGVRVEYHHAYVHMGNAMAVGGKIDSARMTKLTEEITIAAQKGDMATVERLQKEMEGSSQAATKEVAANITIYINGTRGTDLSGASPYPLSNAKYAFLMKDSSMTTMRYIYVGKCKKSGNMVTGTPASDVPNTAAQFMEIIISGDTAKDLAKSLNLKAVNALLK